MKGILSALGLTFTVTKLSIALYGSAQFIASDPVFVVQMLCAFGGVGCGVSRYVWNWLERRINPPEPDRSELVDNTDLEPPDEEEEFDEKEMDPLPAVAVQMITEQQEEQQQSPMAHIFLRRRTRRAA